MYYIYTVYLLPSWFYVELASFVSQIQILYTFFKVLWYVFVKVNTQHFDTGVWFDTGKIGSNQHIILSIFHSY